MAAIHQFASTIEPGAAGSHTKVARDLLRAAGYESEIFAEGVHDACADWGVIPYRKYPKHAKPDDQLVYQFAIGSLVADWLIDRKTPVLVNHHNLTPLRFLAGWDDVASAAVVWGHHQLKALAAISPLGVAVSHYNENDLLHAGFTRTAVAPFLLDNDAFTAEPDETVAAALRDTPGPRWLFVGRIAANKSQHDLVKAFAAYRKIYEPNATLHLVGGGLDGRYGKALTQFVDALGLAGAVTLPGPVSPAALVAYYQGADVFVSMSQHEGFCVPLVEAMRSGVPIVARAEAAVPETLGDGGLLLDDDDPGAVAATVHRVICDTTLREHLVAAGHARSADFDLSRTGPAFVDAVTAVRV